MVGIYLKAAYNTTIFYNRVKHLGRLYLKMTVKKIS